MLSVSRSCWWSLYCETYGRKLLVLFLLETLLCRYL